jgi:hypothetical protein
VWSQQRKERQDRDHQRLGAVCFAGGELYQASVRENLKSSTALAAVILRVRIDHGFLTERGPQWAVECGAAHGWQQLRANNYGNAVGS